LTNIHEAKALMKFCHKAKCLKTLAFMFFFHQTLLCFCRRCRYLGFLTVRCISLVFHCFKIHTEVTTWWKLLKILLLTPFYKFPLISF